MAEKEAWKIADAQDRWDLVTINPSLVVGPGINPNATSESFDILCQFGDGTARPGVPDVGIGVVDVREVAEAHLRAAYLPEANGRYILSGHNTDFPEMAAVLRRRFGKNYPIPKRTLPKAAVWLVGPVVNKTLTRKFVSRNANLTSLVNGSTITRNSIRTHSATTVSSSTHAASRKAQQQHQQHRHHQHRQHRSHQQQQQHQQQQHQQHEHTRQHRQHTQQPPQQ